MSSTRKRHNRDLVAIMLGTKTNVCPTIGHNSSVAHDRELTWVNARLAATDRELTWVNARIAATDRELTDKRFGSRRPTASSRG
jgi:hypothetical protein